VRAGAPRRTRSSALNLSGPNEKLSFRAQGTSCFLEVTRASCRTSGTECGRTRTRTRTITSPYYTKAIAPVARSGCACALHEFRGVRMRCAKRQSVLGVMGWCGQARMSRGACVCVVFEAFLDCLASPAFFVWCSGVWAGFNSLEALVYVWEPSPGGVIVEPSRSFLGSGEVAAICGLLLHS
jgi:hypothetical protein